MNRFITRRVRIKISDIAVPDIINRKMYPGGKIPDMVLVILNDMREGFYISLMMDCINIEWTREYLLNQINDILCN